MLPPAVVLFFPKLGPCAIADVDNEARLGDTNIIAINRAVPIKPLTLGVFRMMKSKYCLVILCNNRYGNLKFIKVLLRMEIYN